MLVKVASLLATAYYILMIIKIRKEFKESKAKELKEKRLLLERRSL